LAVITVVGAQGASALSPLFSRVAASSGIVMIGPSGSLARDATT
jgi:hypothetical protein